MLTVKTLREFQIRGINLKKNGQETELHGTSVMIREWYDSQNLIHLQF